MKTQSLIRIIVIVFVIAIAALTSFDAISSNNPPNSSSNPLRKHVIVVKLDQSAVIGEAEVRQFARNNGFVAIGVEFSGNFPVNPHPHFDGYVIIYVSVSGGIVGHEDIPL